MKTLEQACHHCGLSELVTISEHKDLWSKWQSSQQPLFSKVLESKPQTSATLHLLGMLTKSHIEIASGLTQYLESINDMQTAIAKTVGQEHVNKFKTSDTDELTVITHAWLYIQGFLGMDFSLANDHAHETSKLISSVTSQDVQQLRTQYLESFYLGNQNRAPTSKGSLSQWIKRLFSKSRD
ncbi:hypothetical protein L4D20_17610 [Vibrio kyushuensis]|uniref:hypothetical protein n=1 Tax=Vibrio TaxID=662 RepID=UPI003D1236C9